MDNGAFAAAVYDLTASSALSGSVCVCVGWARELLRLEADTNFRTASDPVRVKVMRIICFPAGERH